MKSAEKKFQVSIFIKLPDFKNHFTPVFKI